MPVFIPPYLGEEVKSNAERKVFEILKEVKLKHAYILHSLGLPKHKSKIYGEIDFVVVFLIFEVISLIKKIRSKRSTNQVNDDNDNKEVNQ